MPFLTMPLPPATINKHRIYGYEENAQRFCFHCSEKKMTAWRLVGYNEFGELWICRECWDQAIDISQEPHDEPGGDISL